MTSGGVFRIERDGDMALLWIDLPGQKVNTLSSSVMTELDHLLDEIAGMREVRRLLIVSGKPGIFIAGADVTEFTKVESRQQAEEFIRFGQNVFRKLSRLPQITIAVINGVCLGGGTELSLNCDYRVMSDDPKASIGLPEVKLGILPAWSGTTMMPRLIGLPAALDLILNGKTLDGRRAKKVGLVDDVIAAPILIEGAKIFASRQKSKRAPGGRTHFYLEGNPLGRGFAIKKARGAVLKQTGGHYPAPLKILEVMETGLAKGVEAGLAAEARAAAELITGAVAPNLVRLFFLMEDAKKLPGPKPKEVHSAGVLGAGLMGGGIAQIVADKADIPVRMKDINWDALAGGMKAAAKIWKKKVDRRRMTRNAMSRKLAMITSTTDWSGFGDVDVAIEAVVENVGIKQSVLREFETVAKEGAIFATNTSTIPITTIASASLHPENVIGMHFFSPVDRMPLVEIILGEKTSEETMATVAALGKRIGKTVVICKDGPGFIVNRILGPYINEAGLLLEESHAIESIDHAMVKFGMPLGPLALLDEVGIDVAGKAAHVMADAFGDRMKPSELIEKLLEDKRYGKKNGRGVYLWTEGKRTAPDPTVYRLAGVANAHEGDEALMTERMVMVMVNEAARILDDGIAFSAADVDLAMIMGTGFPPFRGGLLRYADSIGISKLIEKMKGLAATYGPRFQPAAPLERMGAEGKTFYDAWPKR